MTGHRARSDLSSRSDVSRASQAHGVGEFARVTSGAVQSAASVRMPGISSIPNFQRRSDESRLGPTLAIAASAATSIERSPPMCRKRPRERISRRAAQRLHRLAVRQKLDWAAGASARTTVSGADSRASRCSPVAPQCRVGRVFGESPFPEHCTRHRSRRSLLRDKCSASAARVRRLGGKRVAFMSNAEQRLAHSSLLTAVRG